MKRINPEIKYIQIFFIFAAVFIIYLWSAPRTVVFEDDGLFILSSYFNGISHPPGYPLFTLLGHLSTLIPLGSVAYRVHMLSGLFGALSCVVLYLIAIDLQLGKFNAVLAALCLGYSQVFWSQSIIAEVYTLNILLILILFLLALKWVGSNTQKPADYLLYVMGFTYGLGLSNHWPLLILSTPMLLIIVLPCWKALLRRIHFILVFILLGLTPYAWMYYRSHMDPMISFYGPINSLYELWYVISRKGYAGTDVSQSAGIYDKLCFIWFVLKDTFHQFGVVGGVFVALGFIVQWKMCDKRICYALLAGYLGSTLILILLLGFDFDLLHQNVFKVYPMVSYMATAFWLVFGINYLCSGIKRKFAFAQNWKYLTYMVGVLVVLTELFTNIPLNYRAKDDLAYYYASTILKSLDKNAIFFTFSDVDTPTLGYLHLIEKVRPDVTLYHGLGLILSNRLFNERYTSDDERYRILTEFIKKETRPIYYITEIPGEFASKDYGIYRKVEKGMDKSKVLVAEREDIVSFYERVLQRKKSVDLWESMLQKSLISDYCKLTADMYLALREREPVKFTEPLRVCKGYLGLLTLIDAMLKFPDPDITLLNRLVQEASQLRYESIRKEDYSSYDLLAGKVFKLQGRKTEAVEYFKKAIADWPDPRNEAYTLLKTD